MADGSQSDCNAAATRCSANPIDHPWRGGIIGASPLPPFVRPVPLDSGTVPFGQCARSLACAEADPCTRQVPVRAPDEPATNETEELRTHMNINELKSKNFNQLVQIGGDLDVADATDM